MYIISDLKKIYFATIFLKIIEKYVFFGKEAKKIFLFSCSNGFGRMKLCRRNNVIKYRHRRVQTRPANSS